MDDVLIQQFLEGEIDPAAFGLRGRLLTEEEGAALDYAVETETPLTTWEPADKPADGPAPFRSEFQEFCRNPRPLPNQSDNVKRMNTVTRYLNESPKYNELGWLQECLRQSLPPGGDLKQNQNYFRNGISTGCRFHRTYRSH